MSKTQGNTQNEPCEHSRILRGAGRGKRGGGQNETKKNERKPKSRRLMTKTLVEVRRRPAQCAYACTNKESYTQTYTCIDIYLLYSTHLYTYIHTFAQVLYVCVLHGELPFLLPQNARAALRLRLCLALLLLLLLLPFAWC